MTPIQFCLSELQAWRWKLLEDYWRKRHLACFPALWSPICCHSTPTHVFANNQPAPTSAPDDWHKDAFWIKAVTVVPLLPLKQAWNIVWETLVQALWDLWSVRDLQPLCLSLPSPVSNPPAQMSPTHWCVTSLWLVTPHGYHPWLVTPLTNVLLPCARRLQSIIWLSVQTSAWHSCSFLVFRADAHQQEFFCQMIKEKSNNQGVSFSGKNYNEFPWSQTQMDK